MPKRETGGRERSKENRNQWSELALLPEQRNSTDHSILASKGTDTNEELELDSQARRSRQVNVWAWHSLRSLYQGQHPAWGEGINVTQVTPAGHRKTPSVFQNQHRTQAYSTPKSQLKESERPFQGHDVRSQLFKQKPSKLHQEGQLPTLFMHNTTRVRDSKGQHGAR